MAKINKIEYKEISKDDVRAGQVIRVHQKIKETNAKGEEKERIQVFEGLVLGRKHGKETSATITVRKVSEGIGVEKLFPLYSPIVEKVELVDEKIVNRSKLYYTRDYRKRLKSVSEKKFSTPKKEKAEAKK